MLHSGARRSPSVCFLCTLALPVPFLVSYPWWNSRPARHPARTTWTFCCQARSWQRHGRTLWWWRPRWKVAATKIGSCLFIGATSSAVAARCQTAWGPEHRALLDVLDAGLAAKRFGDGLLCLDWDFNSVPSNFSGMAHIILIGNAHSPILSSRFGW
jgi:hypothetical protein